MRELVITITEVAGGWVARPQGGLATEIFSKYDKALEEAKTSFLREHKSDPLISDYRRAIAKRGGNAPKVKIVEQSSGKRVIRVSYSLRPPAMWKQERMIDAQRG